jgi:thermostable 8-oxoguanine DNA glycosylase
MVKGGMNMSTLLKENPVKKMEYIMSQAASGKTNKELAEELGYKDVHNLYTFMRRRGYVWNGNKGLYAVKGEKQEEEQQEVIEDIPSGKVASIVSMFAKKIDGKEIAKSLRFSNYQEMADYMKSKGYLWDNSKQNYAKAVVKTEIEPVKVSLEPKQEPTRVIRDDTPGNIANQCNCMERYGNIVNFLEANKDKLDELLKACDGEGIRIPRYTLPGYTAPKSLSMSNSLERLIKEFSEDNNISQKEIVEVAIVEFLKKYGYASQVKEVLKV